MRYKIIKKIFVAFVAISSFFLPLSVFATDSTGVSPTTTSDTTSAPVGGQGCVNGALVTTLNPNNPGTDSFLVFPEISTPAQGTAGILCPGKYTINNLYCTISSSGGCGGNSCGWSASLTNAQGATIATQTSHDGCSSSHGNICENQNDVHIYLSKPTLDTSVDTGNLNINLNVESNGGVIYSSCSISVSRQYP